MFSSLTFRSFLEDFAAVPEPRVVRSRKYELMEILFLCLSAGVSGYDDWEEIVDFGRSKLAWLRTYLPYAAGIPSHDTVNRVMGLIDVRAFEKCFITWVQRSITLPSGAQICFDGKRLRRSATAQQQQTAHADGGRSAVHLLHAWCDELGVCIGQYQTPDKANEITALPVLLELLDVRGCVISMDAMGCQKSVVTALTQAGADYLLALKDNQAVLSAAVQTAFADDLAVGAPTTCTEAKPLHGRHETRTVRVLSADALQKRAPQLALAQWAKLASFIEVSATRTILTTGQVQTESRYYLSSLTVEAPDFQLLIRRHWGIENRLHWVLDVTFREDHSRKRTQQAAANFALIRKTALNLLRAIPDKISLQRKRNNCALSDEYRQRCLQI